MMATQRSDCSGASDVPLSSPHSSSGCHGWRVSAGLAAAVAAVAFIGGLALTREFFTYGTETDYLSSFVPEAQRLLQGESLQLDFHPPMYVIVIAAVQFVVRNWFATGVGLSVVAAGIVVFSQFVFFDRLTGRAGAWGAVAALLTSGVFLTFASLASSDLFFLALYSLSLVLALALIASERSRWWWAVLGGLVGIAVLTRTNGVTLLLLVGAPLLGRGNLRERIVNCALVTGGGGVVLAGWIAFATITGSPYGPAKTYANLAMTYYGSGNRVSGESRLPMEEQFDSLVDVVAHDPIKMATMYAKDFVTLPADIFRSQLVVFPLSALAVFGLLLFCFRDMTLLKAGFLAIVLAQVALVNMKTFEERYYLFLAPVLGAAAGLSVDVLHRCLKDARLRCAAYAVLAALLVVSFGASVRGTVRSIHAEDDELGPAIRAFAAHVEDDTIVVSRKTHLAFYSRCASAYMPQCESVTELGQYVHARMHSRPVYIFYGRREQSTRPELSALLRPAEVPSWLHVVAEAEAPARWVLYKVDKDALSALPAVATGAAKRDFVDYSVLDWSDAGGGDSE